MDINRHKSQGKYRLSGYHPGAIVVNHLTYNQSIIITPDQLIDDWEPQTVKAISKKHLAQLIALKPDIILIGTGPDHAFLPESLLMTCYDADIPVEMMSTEKACWLYHILIEEQRQVVAALLP